MSDSAQAAEAPPEPLALTLLSGRAASVEPRPTSAWGYPLAGIVFVTLYIAYHLTVLFVWNLPNKGLSKTFHKDYLQGVKGYEYFRGTRNNQSWAMFAPNPTRTNAFIQILVTDQEGNEWDYNADIWGVDRYPYIWYDRGGKVNRRIDGKKTYQRIYGAYICREWQRHHEGEAARSVRFVKHWTVVPEAQTVIDNGGWDQWAVEPKIKEQETITCKSVPNGQLNNDLRERYGFETLEDDYFVPVKTRSWHDKQEIETKREAKKAERAAAKERRAEARATRIEGTSAPIRDARGPVRGSVVDDETDDKAKNNPGPVSEDNESPDQ